MFLIPMAAVLVGVWIYLVWMGNPAQLVFSISAER